MPRHWRRVTPEKRAEIIRLAAKGLTKHEIAREVGRSYGAVGLVVQPLGGVIRKEMWEPAKNRITLDDRVEIRIGLEQGLSLRERPQAESSSVHGLPRGQSEWRPLLLRAKRSTPPSAPAHPATQADQAGGQSCALCPGGGRP